MPSTTKPTYHTYFPTRLVLRTILLMLKIERQAGKAVNTNFLSFFCLVRRGYRTHIYQLDGRLPVRHRANFRVGFILRWFYFVSIQYQYHYQSTFILAKQ